MGEVPERVLRAIGGPEVVDRLAGLSGSDFTSLMLEVARRRAARENPATLLRRYRSDRFVQPASTDRRRLQQIEDILAAHLPPGTELLTLPPMVPLGTHSVLGPMSQDRVVTAMRASEIAADPTNALALEAAVRRRTGPADAVRLGAFQRVVRAPRPQPGYLPHFSLLGLVTAGRDDGGHRFERAAVTEQVRGLVGGLAAAGLGRAQLALTPLSPAGATIAAQVPPELGDAPVEVVIDTERQAGRGYYRDLCFKINVANGTSPGASADQAWVEVGDGGFTDWIARLTASTKERLLISGAGIDRIVALASGRQDTPG
jgi:hypothetical protein